ncbi:hypothetical protein AGOR_G00080460 [Albula goreensis]|uniref:SCA7 domain-containing protein n=1 Tax=Albula goreensis TaxID=1534307 RepID=A0A8T3DM08_9TELE|nr:hypothetical protein AGOR_G00080460 [Albula goreensis]
MSERADDDVRGEQRKAARLPKQQQQHNQHGESSTAMATVGERRSLPSPEIMLGQPWSNWVDAAKLHGNDGAESEESLKECGKNREAMRLCRDDMPIFGQCPAQDDFYLVMCNYCSQVVKPQAFHTHYERRHGSSSKPLSSAYSIPTLASRRDGSSSSSSSSNNAKILKPAKEKLSLQDRSHTPLHHRGVQHKMMTPAVKVEKIPLKVPEASVKLVHAPSSSGSASSPLKAGLNCPSIPKSPLLAPGQIPNGKGLLSSLDKKQDDGSSSKRQLHKKLSEREFNADFHCGVLDIVTRKPCTRSLTCKTHSLSQRRAVLGRRKRFDALLAEHKSRAREKELQRSSGDSSSSQQAPPLRDPHPSPSRLGHDPHPVSHGNSTADAKPSTPSKTKPHNPSLPRQTSYSSAHPSGNGHAHGHGHSQGDPTLLQEPPHPSVSASDGTSRLSSDEGENEEREESTEKLDCHYSGYHPRPAAFCTFGSRQYGRSCYAFNRRWDRVRLAVSAMVDKHINSQMWKKIPPASHNASHSTPHRMSTNSLPSSHYSAGPAGFMSPASSSHALASPPAQPRQVPAPPPSRPLKSRPSASKAFRSKEPPATVSLSSGKKRKNSLPLSAYPTHPTESSSSSSSSSVSSALKKNCMLNSGGSASYPPSLTTSSSHSTGLNSAPGRTNPLSLKHDQSGRGPPSGSPAEPIKRMSVMMNSSDSTLSLGPFLHQASEQGANSHGHTHSSLDGHLEGKRRKGPPVPSNPSPGRPLKVPKLPTVNNVHSKHVRTIPGTQGLSNNSFIQQPKARP